MDEMTKSPTLSLAMHIEAGDLKGFVTLEKLIFGARRNVSEIKS